MAVLTFSVVQPELCTCVCHVQLSYLLQEGGGGKRKNKILVSPVK